MDTLHSWLHATHGFTPFMITPHPRYTPYIATVHHRLHPIHCYTPSQAAPHPQLHSFHGCTISMATWLHPIHGYTYTPSMAAPSPWLHNFYGYTPFSYLQNDLFVTPSRPRCSQKLVKNRRAGVAVVLGLVIVLCVVHLVTQNSGDPGRVDMSTVT